MEFANEPDHRVPRRPGSPPVGEQALSALNAAFGDYLEQRGNGLALQMTIRAGGRDVAPTSGAVRAAFPAPSAALVVLVHGLAATESVWDFPGAPGTTYGTRLEQDLGRTALVVRYNTGLRVSANGEALAALLEAFVRAYPTPVESIDVIGHSMGGLVLRSALEAARRAGLAWRSRARRAFYLGSPHLGAPLERFANVLAAVLRRVDEPVTNLVGDVLRARSVGVKDMRFANLVREDWEGRDPDAFENGRTLVPLAEDVRHHLVVGALGGDERHPLTRLLGDAMVPVASAAGRARAGDVSPPFPQDRVLVVPYVNHLRLCHHEAVYVALRDWSREP